MRAISFAILCLVISGNAFAGGVSGGGGGVKPANPINQWDLSIAISQARRHATFYLNSLEWGPDYIYLPGHPGLRKKLFQGERSVQDWILALPISENESGPCLDPDGREMDGSARLNPPQVCLSLPRLMEKLSKETVRNQVTALIIHEYAHLTGATEEEADFLQSNAIETFYNADFGEPSQRFYDSEEMLVRVAILSSAELWKELKEKGVDWRSMSESITEIAKEFESAIVRPKLEGAFVVWPYKMWFSSWIEHLRMTLAAQASCALSNGPNRRSCRRSQDKIFQRDTEISYHTYMVRTGHKPGEFGERPGVYFRRIRGIEDAKIELARMQPALLSYWNYLMVLTDRPPVGEGRLPAQPRGLK